MSNVNKFLRKYAVFFICIPSIVLVSVISNAPLSTNPILASLGEFVKTYSNIITVILGLIPAYWLVDVNRKQIQQNTKNAAIQQQQAEANAINLYRKELGETVEENIGKSQTLRALREEIETLKDQGKVKDEEIAKLNADVALLNSTIAALTEDLTSERKARQTAIAELENLKEWAESMVVLLRAANIPIPSYPSGRKAHD